MSDFIKAHTEPKPLNASLQSCCDKNGFMTWVRVGLESFLINKKGILSFPGAISDVGQSDSVEEGLEKAYRKMQPFEQAMFRQALAELISTWEINKENSQVFESLLTLAQLFPAKEALAGLPSWLDYDYLMRLDDNRAKLIYDRIFRLVARLAGANIDTIRCINKLVGMKKFFDPSWAGTALETLWRNDRNNIAKHFAMMRPHLNKIFSEDSSRKEKWADRLLRAIGLTDTIEGLPLLLLNLDTYNKNDYWFLEGLRNGEELLIDQNQCGGLNLSTKSNPYDQIVFSAFKSETEKTIYRYLMQRTSKGSDVTLLSTLSNSKRGGNSCALN